MLGAWKEPLSHAVTELSRMEEAPTAIIAKANIVDTAMSELQEGIRRILGTVCSFLMFLCFSSSLDR